MERDSCKDTRLVDLNGDALARITEFLPFEDFCRLLFTGSKAIHLKLEEKLTKLSWSHLRSHFANLNAYNRIASRFTHLESYSFTIPNAYQLAYVSVNWAFLPKSLRQLKLEFRHSMASFMSNHRINEMWPNLEILNLRMNEVDSGEMPVKAQISLKNLPSSLVELRIVTPTLYHYSHTDIAHLPSNLEVFDVNMMAIRLQDENEVDKDISPRTATEASSLTQNTTNNDSSSISDISTSTAPAQTEIRFQTPRLRFLRLSLSWGDLELNTDLLPTSLTHIHITGKGVQLGSLSKFPTLATFRLSPEHKPRPHWSTLMDMPTTLADLRIPLVSLDRTTGEIGWHHLRSFTTDEETGERIETPKSIPNYVTVGEWALEKAKNLKFFEHSKDPRQGLSILPTLYKYFENLIELDIGHYEVDSDTVLPQKLQTLIVRSVSDLRVLPHSLTDLTCNVKQWTSRTEKETDEDPRKGKFVPFPPHLKSLTLYDPPIDETKVSTLPTTLAYLRVSLSTEQAWREVGNQLKLQSLRDFHHPNALSRASSIPHSLTSVLFGHTQSMGRWWEHGLTSHPNLTALHVIGAQLPNEFLNYLPQKLESLTLYSLEKPISGDLSLPSTLTSLQIQRYHSTAVGIRRQPAALSISNESAKQLPKSLTVLHLPSDTSPLPDPTSLPPNIASLQMGKKVWTDDGSSEFAKSYFARFPPTLHVNGVPAEECH